MREKLEQVCAELKGMGHGAAITMRKWPQATLPLKDLQRKAMRAHATILEVLAELDAEDQDGPVDSSPTPSSEPIPEAAPEAASISDDIFNLPIGD